MSENANNKKPHYKNFELSLFLTACSVVSLLALIVSVMYWPNATGIFLAGAFGLQGLRDTLLLDAKWNIALGLSQLTAAACSAMTSPLVLPQTNTTIHEALFWGFVMLSLGSIALRMFIFRNDGN